MAARPTGVYLHRASPIDSAASISDPAWTVTALHAQLYARDSALFDRLIAAIREFAQDERVETVVAAFEDAGLTAVDGTLARACQSVARGDWAGVRWLATELGSFAHGTTGGGLHTSVEDVFAGPSQLFAHVDETPTIGIRLPDAETLRETRADHRERVRRLLGILGEGCRVILTGTYDAREFLWMDGHDDPHLELADVTEDVDPRHTSQPAVVETAEAALADGLARRKWRILETLADAHGETAEYSELYADRGLCSSEETVRAYAHDLADRDLVRRQNGTVGLTAGGALAVERRRAQLGEQSELAQFSASSETPPNPSGDIRVGPDAGEGKGDGEAHAAVEPGPAERRNDGFVSVSFLSQSEHHAAMSTAPQGAIGLADTPVAEPADQRVPLVSVDAARGEVVAGGHFTTPLSWLVCTARALSSPKVLDLLVDRLGDREGLDRLFDGDRRITRQMAQCGYLSDDVQTPAEYRTRIEAEISGICELTSRRKDAEGSTFADLTVAIMQRSHGLIATITRLLECCDVDLSRLVYLPQYSQNLHTSGDGFRSELLRTLTLVTLRGSKQGAYNPYRTLYEHREEKRQSIAGTPSTGEPGELIGQFCIAGDGVSKLLSPETGLGIDDALADPSIVDDHLVAQEEGENFSPLEVEVGIHRDRRRPRIAEATRRMCADRNLAATDVAISTLTALTGSVFDVTTAIAHLGTESSSRAIHLDEVRFALKMLDRDRLLPDLRATTPRKVLSCLLHAEEPLSQAAIARQTGVSTQSIRDNHAILLALSLIERTEVGWRFGLPDREERGTSQDATSWLQSSQTMETDTDPYETTADALPFDHLLLELADRDPDAAGPPPGIEGGIAMDLPALAEHSPWVREWLPVVASLTGVELDPSAFGDVRGEGGVRLPLDAISVRVGVTQSEVGLSSYGEGVTG